MDFIAAPYIGGSKNSEPRFDQTDVFLLLEKCTVAVVGKTV